MFMKVRSWGRHTSVVVPVLATMLSSERLTHWQPMWCACASDEAVQECLRKVMPSSQNAAASPHVCWGFRHTAALHALGRGARCKVRGQKNRLPPQLADTPEVDGMTPRAPAAAAWVLGCTTGLHAEQVVHCGTAQMLQHMYRSPGW